MTADLLARLQVCPPLKPEDPPVKETGETVKVQMLDWSGVVF